MARVLITGAFGFIGRYVATEFAKQGYYVLGMGHSTWKDKEFEKYGIKEFYNCDITLESLCKLKHKNINIIVHCAGSGSVAESERNPDEAFAKTVVSTQSCLEFIRICDKQIRLIYLSSAAVYGNVEKVPIAESCKLNPISVYGYHKILSENICEMYAKQYSIDVIILRLFSVYGQGLRKQLLYDACNKFKHKSLVFIGTGLEIRDFIHINDVAKIIVAMGKIINKNCEIYNVGCGQGTKIKDVLKILAINYFSCEIGISFSGNSSSGNPDTYIADITKLSKLGVDGRVLLEQGAKEYVEWFKNEEN